ncbi:zinc finger CCHC domain-containing protein 8 [Coregonus clupeaformis]|uniref:zinc finger CCHC domain-containing protein 8 n=1 Tax=Coregonus clupeaformis TaxID=59861 RepID=UPI001E1C7FC7|nr:zinc finger CCHC domain-containing protein 8 [Coregonus clupeaformis]
MAEVDFGDSELFEQLEESMPVATHIRFTEEGGEEGSELKERLEECEETIRSLIEDNQELKRKLKVLTRPSGINVENIKIDGPLLQILFANNSISKQCRQEIEDSICSIVQKHQQQGEVEKGNPSGNVNPQSSSFIMEEDQKTKTCGIKKMKEAFSMVGSVLYFTSFCLDKLGQPLLNDNPQQTEGWEVPKYQQVFSQVIALDGQEVQMKEKRPKPCCFNCGLDGHQLRDCPQPKDMARINEKRKEFSHGNQGNLSNQRYHAEEVEERFARYKPGIVSEELMSALGVDTNTLPPHIYRMRQLGYPPGWLKEAEMENSGLMLYDGKVSNAGELTEEDNGQSISYDVSKLVDFPGFNISALPSVKDDYRLYGSIPIQHNHMKQNFADYLSNNFPMPGANCNKRLHESESTPRQTKKRRSDARSSDMDVDSDQDTTPRRHRSSDSFQFQPPLPPGSPSFGSPPPLPHGTPPATPTPPPLPKGTPPPTPTNGSPALRGRTVGVGEESAVGEEEELTLEELEEQQRLIWAALENADTTTNSDSETPAVGTPLPSSPSVSTPAQVDTETEMEEGEAEDEEKERSVEVSSHNSDEQISVDPSSSKCQDDEEDAEDKGKVVEDESSLLKTPVQEESPMSPEAAADRGNVLAQRPSLLQTPVQQESSQPNPSDQDAIEGDLSDSVGKVTAVPHRSRFAQGIIPFEDTPEFTEVAEATGTYLRIRDLLKGSPRNMAKNKK